MRHEPALFSRRHHKEAPDFFGDDCTCLHNFSRPQLFSLRDSIDVYHSSWRSGRAEYPLAPRSSCLLPARHELWPFDFSRAPMVAAHHRDVLARGIDPHRFQHDGAHAVRSGGGGIVWFPALSVSLHLYRGIGIDSQRRRGASSVSWRKRSSAWNPWRDPCHHNKTRRRLHAGPAFAVDQLPWIFAPFGIHARSEYRQLGSCRRARCGFRPRQNICGSRAGEQYGKIPRAGARLDCRPDHRRQVCSAYSALLRLRQIIAELARNHNRVVKSGKHSKRSHGVNQSVVYPLPIRIWIRRSEHYSKNKHNLKERSKFAVNAGWKWPVSGNQNNYSGNDEQQNVTAQHHNRKPPRHFLCHRQNYERRREQQLVRNRIEVSAERGPLIQPARQHAVDSVAQSRNYQNQERPFVLIV